MLSAFNVDFISCVIYFCFVFAELGVEPRTLNMQGGCSDTGLHHQLSSSCFILTVSLGYGLEPIL